jgi:hypothetical protein
MADPITLAAGSMAIGAVGSVIQGFGASQQAGAQSGMFAYQAGVARANQTIADQNAKWESQSGEVEAQQAGLRAEDERSKSTVAAAAGNIDVTTGSSVQVGKSITEIGGENQTIIRANAAKRAYGATIEGFEQGAQANIYDAASKNARAAGDIAELSSFVGGAGGVANKWLQMGPMFGTGGGDSWSGSKSIGI